MLRFSANLGFLWQELPLVERVRRAAAAGFDAVELHYPYDVPAERLRAALTEAGLPVLGLNTRLGDAAAGEFGLAALPGRGAEARAAIDEALAYARAIGAGYVHVTAGKPKEARAAEARNAYLAALAHAAEQAGADVSILIEPLNRRDVPGYFLADLEQAAGVIAELALPNVKILFDCYHAQVSGGDLTSRIERLLPLIGHIQVAGVPARAEPDEGEVAYDRLLTAIEAMGYSGFVGAEYRPRGTVEEGVGWLAAFRGTAVRHEARRGLEARPRT
jgi:hydroxypyruvate isomerase